LVPACPWRDNRKPTPGHAEKKALEAYQIADSMMRQRERAGADLKAERGILRNYGATHS
jgi:hypothetical protein